MSGFTECPNCAKDRLGVPLMTEDNSKVCPLCESVFRLKNNIDTLERL